MLFQCHIHSDVRQEAWGSWKGDDTKENLFFLGIARHVFSSQQEMDSYEVARQDAWGSWEGDDTKENS